MHKYLYVTVFVSGLTTLAVEMAASRLLGSVFGTSNLVWASIIGLILIYLAAGYFLGGYWADRSPTFRTFYKILVWASVGIVIVPVIARPILQLAANAFDHLEIGILAGSFGSVLVLLVIPMILLGTASPFAIRLAVQDGKTVGSVSGKIYATSTIGSFIGTFLPVLLLIPTIGTHRTFLVSGSFLLLIALAGLWLYAGWKAVIPYLWTLVLIPALFVWGLPGGTKNTTGQVYETESAYNYIQVLEQDGYTLLRLNEGQGIHSIYHPDKTNYFGPWEQVLVAPFFNPAPYPLEQVKRLAIIGLAAGTTAREASLVYDAIEIDGYEIDPEIVRVGRLYFDMNEPNLNVIVQDGRWGLEHSPYQYQIISIDAYRPPYIPFHLTTQEFFQIARRHLTNNGVMVINVGRAPNDRRLINALGSTILTVFPTIHVVDIPNTFNSMLFATVQPTTADNFLENLLYLSRAQSTPSLLLDTMKITAANLQKPPEAGPVFTDDKAPVEWITNNMVLSFLFSGEMENLE
ncbi:MAG: fused MFS/spermidine synthase [Anaerolineae bacterium]|nr:fused MFS/spermidine synthase [Anaerolineae bacterium]